MVAFLRLALRRVAMMPVMILGIALLVFVVLQFSPADPAFNALGESATPEAREAFAEANGLNDPLPVRYFDFLGQLLHFDLGVTVPPSQPVIDRITAAFPLTLQLTFLGLLLAIVLAVVVGVLGALYRDRWPDQLFRVFSMAGVAVPSFWLGVLLIQRFALDTRDLPDRRIRQPRRLVRRLAHSDGAARALARRARRRFAARAGPHLDGGRTRPRLRPYGHGNGVPVLLVIRSNVLRNALVTPVTVLGVASATCSAAPSSSK